VVPGLGWPVTAAGDASRSSSNALAADQAGGTTVTSDLERNRAHHTLPRRSTGLGWPEEPIHGLLRSDADASAGAGEGAVSRETSGQVAGDVLTGNASDAAEADPPTVAPTSVVPRETRPAAAPAAETDPNPTRAVEHSSTAGTTIEEDIEVEHECTATEPTRQLDDGAGSRPAAADPAPSARGTHRPTEPLPRPASTRVMVVAYLKGGVG
jgi:hypothetical protein